MNPPFLNWVMCFISLLTDGVKLGQTPSATPNDRSFSKHWKLRTSTTFKRPSAIDNLDLIKQSDEIDAAIGFELRDNLVDGAHFVLLPEQIWNQLPAWYGGGPTLARKVISSGLMQNELSVEVYRLRLHLHLIPTGDRCTLRISKKETVGELHRSLCDIWS